MLYKRGQFTVSGWKHLWFQVKGGLFNYYKKKGDDVPLGSITIAMITYVYNVQDLTFLPREMKNSDSAFIVDTHDKVYYLLAPDRETMWRFVDGLDKLSKYYNGLSPQMKKTTDTTHHPAAAAPAPHQLPPENNAKGGDVLPSNLSEFLSQSPVSPKSPSESKSHHFSNHDHNPLDNFSVSTDFLSCSGFLVKRGPSGLHWKSRYYQIVGDRLNYYEHMEDTDPISFVPIKAIKHVAPIEDHALTKLLPPNYNFDGAFLLDAESKVIYLCAPSQDMRNQWMRVLDNCRSKYGIAVSFLESTSSHTSMTSGALAMTSSKSMKVNASSTAVSPVVSAATVPVPIGSSSASPVASSSSAAAAELDDKFFKPNYCIFAEFLLGTDNAAIASIWKVAKPAEKSIIASGMVRVLMRNGGDILSFIRHLIRNNALAPDMGYMVSSFYAQEIGMSFVYKKLNTAVNTIIDNAKKMTGMGMFEFGPQGMSILSPLMSIVGALSGDINLVPIGLRIIFRDLVGVDHVTSASTSSSSSSSASTSATSSPSAAAATSKAATPVKPGSFRNDGGAVASPAVRIINMSKREGPSDKDTVFKGALFLFQNFLVPAISQPTVYGLTSEEPLDFKAIQGLIFLKQALRYVVFFAFDRISELCLNPEEDERIKQEKLRSEKQTKIAGSLMGFLNMDPEKGGLRDADHDVSEEVVTLLKSQPDIVKECGKKVMDFCHAMLSPDNIPAAISDINASSHDVLTWVAPADQPSKDLSHLYSIIVSNLLGYSTLLKNRFPRASLDFLLGVTPKSTSIQSLSSELASSSSPAPTSNPTPTPAPSASPSASPSLAPSPSPAPTSSSSPAPLFATTSNSICKRNGCNCVNFVEHQFSKHRCLNCNHTSSEHVMKEGASPAASPSPTPAPTQPSAAVSLLASIPSDAKPISPAINAVRGAGYRGSKTMTAVILTGGRVSSQEDLASIANSSSTRNHPNAGGASGSSSSSSVLDSNTRSQRVARFIDEHLQLVLILCDVRPFTTKDSFSDLMRSLKACRYRLLRILSTTLSSAKQDKACNSIISLFETSGANEVLNLFRFVVKEEVQKTVQVQTLFRSDSFATKLSKAYSMKVGLPYMRRLFAPIFANLGDSSLYEIDPSKIVLPEGASAGAGAAGGGAAATTSDDSSPTNDGNANSSSSSTSLSPDASAAAATEAVTSAAAAPGSSSSPSSAATEAIAQANLERLLALCTTMLEAIVKSVSSMPLVFRDICRILHSEVLNKFHSDSAAQLAVGGFLFLRFFVSGIMYPEKNGVVETLPESKRRSLILVSKIIQNVANNCEFGGAKEEFMMKCNGFVLKYIPVVIDFYKAVVEEDSEPDFIASATPIAGGAGAGEGIVTRRRANTHIMAHASQEETKVLCEFISESIDDIRNVIRPDLRKFYVLFCENGHSQLSNHPVPIIEAVSDN